MFVSQKALNGRHLAMYFFQRGVEQKWRHLAEEEARAGIEIEITAYGFRLDPVTYFKYLGRFLTAEDNAWPAVVCNLWRARQKWPRMNRILSR